MISRPTICQTADYIASYIKKYYYICNPHLVQNHSTGFHNQIKYQVISEYLKNNKGSSERDRIDRMVLFGYGVIDFSKETFDPKVLDQITIDPYKNTFRVVIDISDIAFFYNQEYTHDWIICIMDMYCH